MDTQQQDISDGPTPNLASPELTGRFQTALIYNQQSPNRCTIVMLMFTQFVADIETFILTVLGLPTNTVFRMLPDHDHYAPYLAYGSPFHAGVADFASLVMLFNTATLASHEIDHAVKENALGMGSQRRSWICSLVPAFVRMRPYGAFVVTLIRVWIFAAGCRYIMYHHFLREWNGAKYVTLGILLFLIV